MLVPPDEDIHRVENSGDTLAISIHVYGADISVLGSSINEQFADDLVRERTTRVGAEPVSWRQQCADDERPHLGGGQLDLSASADARDRHRPLDRRRRRERGPALGS